MKKLILITTGLFFIFTINAEAIKWSGSMEPRYFTSSYTLRDADDATNTDYSETIVEMMAELGLSDGNKKFAWGLKFRTDGGAPNIVHAPFGMYGNISPISPPGLISGLPITLSEAWVRYRQNFGFGFVNITVGQQQPVFLMGEHQLFMDSDVNLGGLGWTWQKGAYGLRLAQYAFMGNSAVSGGKLGSLLSFQGTLKWRFTNRIRTTFAVGYHRWSGPDPARVECKIIARALPISNHLRRNDNGSSEPGSREPEPFLTMPSSSQIQVLAKTSLPYNIQAEFEMIMNSSQEYEALTTGETGDVEDINTTAWLLGLTWKRLKKPGDFSFTGSYGSKGIGSVYENFTYDRFSPGYSGFMLNGKYKLSSSLMLGGEFGSFSELSPTDAYGRKTFNGDGEEFAAASYSYFQVSAGMKF